MIPAGIAEDIYV